MLRPGEGAGILIPLEIIHSSRIKMQQAEELGICSYKGGEGGGGHLPAMVPQDRRLGSGTVIARALHDDDATMAK